MPPSDEARKIEDFQRLKSPRHDPDRSYDLRFQEQSVRINFTTDETQFLGIRSRCLFEFIGEKDWKTDAVSDGLGGHARMQGLDSHRAVIVEAPDRQVGKDFPRAAAGHAKPLAIPGRVAMSQGGPEIELRHEGAAILNH